MGWFSSSWTTKDNERDQLRKLEAWRRRQRLKRLKRERRKRWLGI